MMPIFRIHAPLTPAPAGPGTTPSVSDGVTDLLVPAAARRAEVVSEAWTPQVPSAPTVAEPAPPAEAVAAPSRAGSLPWVARVYVGLVIAAGLALAVWQFPPSIPDPGLSIGLLALVCVTSVLKVSLPVPNSSATMSISFVADFIAILMLGPQQAALMAGMGAFVQCVVNRKPESPLAAHRVIFSVAALIVTVHAAGAVFALFGGHAFTGDLRVLAKPVVAAAMAHFLSNTVLVALAAGLATRRPVWRLWHDAFLWSAPSYFVGAGVAAVSAILIDRGDAWFAPMVAAPIYLTYRTYQIYLGRIHDEERHVDDVTALHQRSVRALDQARRSEHALTVERERLSVTLGKIGEAVIATDPRGRIVLLNQSAELFTGWTHDDAVGRPVAEVLRLTHRENGKPCASPVEQVIRTHAAVERDASCAVVSRDGSVRLVELSAMPVCDEDGAIVAVVLVVRDMTESLRAEEERQRASKLASLGVLAGGIAHDFNNILTAIVGNISLAQMEPGTAQLHGSLAEAERACVRARSLTQQLLTFSKGGAPLKKAVVLHDLLREAVSFALHGSNVRCEFHVPDDLWAVDADEGQLVQVVNNLVINAKQAMPDGGVIHLRAENVPASVSGTVAEVRIAIEDHGTGIAEEHLGRIFDPYFTTKKSGSGLGLATCYSIVRNHGGHMSVQSTLGVGTTMAVALPVSANVDPAAAAAARAAQAAGKGRVLLMDDEDAIRTLARAMLGRLGYRVEAVPDGRAAVEAYDAAHEAGDPFHLVIMDLTVPGGMGGKDAIKEILAIDPEAVGIVSSGYADDPVMSSFRQYGFAGVVPKPFTIAELRRVIEQLLH
jgi:PAS domain S-box-containing protein